MGKVKPIDYASYQRTGNNAIDLVAQAAGYIRATGRPVKAYVLKPTSYDLFRAGLEIMMNAPLDPVSVLTWEGVEIRKGGRAQFESLVIEYYTRQDIKN